MTLRNKDSAQYSTSKLAKSIQFFYYACIGKVNEMLYLRALKNDIFNYRISIKYIK